LHKSHAAVFTHNEYLNRTIKYSKNFFNKSIEYKGKISLVQEPYFNINSFHIKGFGKDLKLYVGKSNCKVRACIITSKDVNAWLLSQFSNEDMTTVATRDSNCIKVFSSVYLPFDSPQPPPSTLLKHLVEHCEEKGWGLTIGADANSQNIIWGSTKINPRGTQLADWIYSTSDINIVNTGTKPTFVNSIREEVIDVTLCNNSNVDRIENWRVSDDVTHSDHNRIEFDFLLNQGDSSNETYRNVKRTDWIKYSEELSNNIKVGNSESLDGMAEELDTAFNSAFFASSKLFKVRKQKKPPWWTMELTELSRDVQRTKRRCKKHARENNREAYREAKRKYKYALRSAQSEGWKKHVTEMEDLTSSARLVKILKSGKKTEIGTVRKPNGEYTATPEETLQVLLDTHFPNQEEEEDGGEEDIDLERILEAGNLDIDSIVNTQSVRACFKSFQPFKAPGPDGIYPALLQKGSDIISEKVIKIYKKSLKEGKIPKKWLESRVVFIPKPGKMDYSDPKSVRPISLACFLLKGLERLVFWYIKRTTLKHNKLHRNLYSYKESVSTEDALHSLVHKVEKAMEKKEIAVVLFLDIDAAFSKASIKGILRNMEKKGIEPGIIKWCEYMLRNRQVIATLNGKIVIKIPTRGTPQGGILSIIFWNLEPDDLLDMFPKVHPSLINAFADDLSDAVVGIDMSSIESRLQQDIKVMEAWAKKSGLSFSASKTKVMVFTTKKNIRAPRLIIQGEVIEVVPTFKYLGITLDNKLTWVPHIKNIARRATMTMAQCRKMVGKNWGLKPKVCLWMYTSLIRPILTYASFVWVSALEKEYKRKMLEKVQRQGCLLILSAMRSTPPAGMEVILGIRPIEVHIKELAIKSYLRLVKNGNWKHIKGEVIKRSNHAVIITEMAEEIPEIFLPTDKLLEKELGVSNFKTNIKRRTDIIGKTIRLTPTQVNTLHCFTDGSKTKTGSGFGYIMRGGNIKAQGYDHLGKLATVFQAEITALEYSGQRMLDLNIKGMNIQFYVDSQAAIKAVSNYCISSKSVLNAKQTLNCLGVDNNITINWIPSHVGYLGNEVADRLAKLGSYGNETHRTRPEPYIPVSISNSKTLIKDWGQKLHQEIWTNPKDPRFCRQTRMMLNNVKNNIWKLIKGGTRKEAWQATQMLTGHASINKHLKNIKVVTSAACDKCKYEEESIEHFLGHCPAYNRLRTEIFGTNIINSGDFSKLRLRDLQRFANRSKRFEYTT
jgi:ribonuclease HI